MQDDCDDEETELYYYHAAANLSLEALKQYRAASGRGSFASLIRVENEDQEQLFYAQVAVLYDGWLDIKDIFAAYFHVPKLSILLNDIQYESSFELYQNLTQPYQLEM